MSIGVLGPITFEVNADKARTWHDARRDGDSRWATHEVFGDKPKSEFLGPGLDTITLAVRFDITRGVVPRDEIRELRKQRDTGAVLQFTIGGELVGDFVLKGISEDWQRMTNQGVLTAATCTLKLEEYR